MANLTISFGAADTGSSISNNNNTGGGSPTTIPGTNLPAPSGPSRQAIRALTKMQIGSELLRQGRMELAQLNGMTPNSGNNSGSDLGMSNNNNSGSGYLVPPTSSNSATGNAGGCGRNRMFNPGTPLFASNSMDDGNGPSFSNSTNNNNSGMGTITIKL
jgi:hypothetical protein